FREVVAAAETRFRIDARHLGVRQRGQEAERERERDACPHVARHRATVRGRCGRLELKRRPEKTAGGDERHRVHRRARETECRLHLWLFCHARLLRLESDRWDEVRAASDVPVHFARDFHEYATSTGVVLPLCWALPNCWAA